MRTSPRVPTVVAVLLLVPLLLGKNKCKSEPPSLENPLERPTDPINNPEVALQVVSIRPSVLAPDTPTVAKVFGAGFQAGATARVDSKEVSATFTNENTLSVNLPGLQPGVYDLQVSNPDGQTSTLRSGVSVESKVDDSCYELRVYFTLDQAGLTSEARQLLGTKVDCLSASRGRVQIDGHADERGTTDYNVALGERRAVSVKRYLVSLGLQTARVHTTSYGEERPTNPSSTEEAWALNRRAEIRVVD